MAKTPKRLVTAVQFANATATLYTTPSYIPNTLVTLVRHIHVSNPTGSSATKFTLAIGTDSAAKRIYDVYPLAAGQVFDAWVYIPLTTGELITGFADVATAMTIWIDGDENV
jgi:hypothetical protein